MKTVYIETSVVSYLTARPSRDMNSAVKQQITQEWWNVRRHLFKLFISEVVEKEAMRGDTEAAARRLASMETLENLDIGDDELVLAEKIMDGCGLPKSAEDDALHIAIAAVHGVDYLVTWNCRHIDNAEIKPIIRAICAVNGYICPEICTPEELMGEWKHER